MMKDELTAEEVIDLLRLKKHPLEGGWFRETYRSEATMRIHDGERPAGTAIYYMLTTETFSEFHRLPGDELFHFYLGDPVTMAWLMADGSCCGMTLGPDLRASQMLQVVVPGGVWQGMYLNEGGAWALLGTTMSPGFDYADYESAERDALLEQYPDEAELILRLTHEPTKE